MKTKSFLIGSLALCFASVAFAQTLPQIPTTKASWEFGFNYGVGARSFQAVQGSSASKNLPNGVGMAMLNYQLIFNNKWLLAAEMGFLGDHSNKKCYQNGYNSTSKHKDTDIGVAQATLMAGYNLLNRENWRLFGVAGVGGGSVALNPTVYGSNGNLDNRQHFSTFQVGLMGQYLIKLGKPRAYGMHSGRRNCCCCCNKQQPEPEQQIEQPKKYMQWVMPITFSLTFHKSRSQDFNQTNNNVVTSIAGQEGEALDLRVPPTNSYYQNFSGVSFAMYIGFGGQRRNVIAD